MNLQDAMRLALKNNKRLKRQNWINFLEPSILNASLSAADILSEDFIVEDDILTISVQELKEKIKFLKAQDQKALLDYLGLK